MKLRFELEIEPTEIFAALGEAKDRVASVRDELQKILQKILAVPEIRELLASFQPPAQPRNGHLRPVPGPVGPAPAPDAAGANGPSGPPYTPPFDAVVAENERLWRQPPPKSSDEPL